MGRYSALTATPRLNCRLANTYTQPPFSASHVNISRLQKGILLLQSPNCGRRIIVACSHLYPVTHSFRSVQLSLFQPLESRFKGVINSNRQDERRESKLQRSVEIITPTWSWREAGGSGKLLAIGLFFCCAIVFLGNTFSSARARRGLQ